MHDRHLCYRLCALTGSGLTLLWLILISLCGCEQLDLPSVENTPIPTATLPALGPAQAVAEQFAQAWGRGEARVMYQLLTETARQTISESAFVERYEAVHHEAQVSALSATVGAVELETPERVRAELVVSFESVLVGKVEAGALLMLGREPAGWRIEWTPEAILKGLTKGRYVKLFPKASQRGNIYARDGASLARQARLVTVGVVPNWITDEAKMLDVLSASLDMPRESIREKYVYAARQDWFMPIAELPPEQGAALRETLLALPGVSFQETSARIYSLGQMGAHVIGYTGKISAAELEEWQALGYGSDDVVGRTGVERWAERYLSGQRGGTLAIVDGAGQIVSILKERIPNVSRSVYLSLDMDLQQAAFEALGDHVGAIVALDPKSGDVLAMVSAPSFDANLISRGLSQEAWQALLDNPDRPLVDRAAQGLYPPASVFKIVTTAAALDAGVFSPGDTFFCTGVWDGLNDGLERACWLSTGHGAIDLMDGLVQSCDVVYYELGKALDIRDQALLPTYARRFGLGELTGIEGIDERAGLVPDAQWKEANPDAVSNPFWTTQDAVNMAIGQGYLLATPLQMANMLAAVANGGTLYRPRLVQEIKSLGGGETLRFDVAAQGTLPINQEHLALIRAALRDVAMSPAGTAYPAFQDMAFPVAGKTGTAESEREESHAWFAGYAPADDPQIAVAVIAEYGGEGSSVAAPIFRQVVERFLLRPTP